MKRTVLTMCTRTLIGILFPNTVRWGSSVTHLWPVATVSKCLCLAKEVKGMVHLVLFSPLNLVRQFDTSEKCNQGGYISFYRVWRAVVSLPSWSRLLGIPAGPVTPHTWDLLGSCCSGTGSPVCGMCDFRVTLLTLSSELYIRYYLSFREDLALLPVPWPPSGSLASGPRQKRPWEWVWF